MGGERTGVVVQGDVQSQVRVQSDGRLWFAKTGASTDKQLDLHWESTNGVVRSLDGIPQRFPYLQDLNLEGHRISDVSALSSLLSLRELTISGNRVANIEPLSSCLMLSKLDLSDNMIQEIPPSFRSLVMLRQLFVAGNQITKLTTFEALASLPALVEISIARNPVCSHTSGSSGGDTLGSLSSEEYLISQLRQLQCIDGRAISHDHRQSVLMQAAKQKLLQLEEQVSLQDGSILEMSVAQQRSDSLLKGIERLIMPNADSTRALTEPDVQAPSRKSLEENVASPQQQAETRASRGYLPVNVSSDMPPTNDATEWTDAAAAVRHAPSDSTGHGLPLLAKEQAQQVAQPTSVIGPSHVSELTKTHTESSQNAPLLQPAIENAGSVDSSSSRASYTSRRTHTLLLHPRALQHSDDDTESTSLVPSFYLCAPAFFCLTTPCLAYLRARVGLLSVPPKL
jgi:hypothetical protein